MFRDVEQPADVTENRERIAGRLEQNHQKIELLSSLIKDELDNLMNLTFHLIKMDDPKITLNSCLII